jgi:hypothetical protein
MSDYTPLEQWLYDAGVAMPGAVRPLARQIETSDWLAAHDAEKRAEWEAEQGEMEWGYLSGETSIAGDPHVQSVGADGEPFTREQASSRGRPAMRRTKGIPAGPWMPVEQEGESNA